MSESECNDPKCLCHNPDQHFCDLPSTETAENGDIALCQECGAPWTCVDTTVEPLPMKLPAGFTKVWRRREIMDGGRMDEEYQFEEDLENAPDPSDILKLFEGKKLADHYRDMMSKDPVLSPADEEALRKLLSGETD